MVRSSNRAAKSGGTDGNIPPLGGVGGHSLERKVPIRKSRQTVGVQGVPGAGISGARRSTIRFATDTIAECPDRSNIPPPIPTGPPAKTPRRWARQIAPVVGLAWKDAPEASQAWLAKLGNPYTLSVSDSDGRAAIDWGVYGAPETFVIDKAGIVRDKHVGALTAEVIEQRLVPLIARLKTP